MNHDQIVYIEDIDNIDDIDDIDDDMATLDVTSRQKHRSTPPIPKISNYNPVTD